MSTAVASRSAKRATSQSTLPLPMPAPAAISLLRQAQRGLRDGETAQEPVARFTASYHSALRAGAAVLAARGRPHRGRSRPASVWVLLESAAPELREWTAFFAANSATHAGAEAGITRGITPHMADDLLRQSSQFADLAHQAVHRRR